MELQNNYNTGTFGYEQAQVEAKAGVMIKNVYLWMTLALAITGLTAFYVASTPKVLAFIFSSKAVFFGLMIAELALVIGLSAAINRISALTATLMFMLYSVINGATMASIFLAYTASSIATTFFVTAGTFGVMAVFGSITKRDLSKMGNILIMAVIGLIIATLVNLFLKNTMMDLIISGVGVLIFTGLTAYDSQRIKAMLYNAPENDMTSRIAVIGALNLYLDFINMFLYLLRFFGSRN